MRVHEIGEMGIWKEREVMDRVVHMDGAGCGGHR